MLVFIFCEIVLTWSSTCNPQFHYEYYVSSACFLVKRKWLVRISFAGNFHSISKKGVTHSYYKFGAYSSPSGLNARRKKKKTRNQMCFLSRGWSEYTVKAPTTTTKKDPLFCVKCPLFGVYCCSSVVPHRIQYWRRMPCYCAF